MGFRRAFCHAEPARKKRNAQVPSHGPAAEAGRQKQKDLQAFFPRNKSAGGRQECAEICLGRHQELSYKRLTVQDKEYLKPPRLAEWILRRIFPDRGDFSTLGDLSEVYQDLVKQKNVLFARLWYWRQLLKSLPLSFIDYFYWRMAVLKNHIKLTVRIIQRNKAFSIINVTGLAVGIACCFLILSWVRYELSYDRFHENADEIYRVISEFRSSGGDINCTTTNQAPLAVILKDRYPEIVDSARALRWPIVVGTKQKKFKERVWLVDPSLCDIFTFKFIGGDPKTALSDPHSIILSEHVAKKHFEEDDPLGKSILLGSGRLFQISGIVEDLPKNSHLDIDCLIPLVFTKELGVELEEWSGFNFLTYIQFQKNASQVAVEGKIKNILKDYMPETSTTIRLQPLAHIHSYALGGGGLILYIRIFLVMAVFILIIAAINYMNLSTARSGGRAREVGVRQTIGAKRSQLIRQFMSESMALSIVATSAAVVLVHLFLPSFNRLTGRVIELDYSFLTLSMLVGIALIMGTLSGIYPAAVLSSYKPVNVLKGVLSSRKDGARFRRILVVTQFSISIFLIIGTMVIYKQVRFFRNKDLGYNKENILCLSMSGAVTQNYNAIRNELLSHPDVLGMTRTNTTLDTTQSTATSNVISWEGQDANERIPWLHVVGVDYDYLDTFGLKMTEGRFFSEEYPSDPKDGMIVNQAAIRAMNMDSPVGKKFHFWDLDGRIIGVINDYHFRSLHDPIEPLVLKLGLSLNTLSIKIRSENIAGTIKTIETGIKKIVPDYTLEYEFLDERLNTLYQAEQRMEKIAKSISLLAIFLSCMGLLGLAVFTMERRAKEIGIRKVLGASMPSILMLLTREFAKWVLVANMVAWPAAYIAAKLWLENFANRTTVGLWMFALSGLITFLIAFLTVSFQAIKASLTNPVNSLRCE
jgi:putative ABC transport system permease protein